MSQFPDENPSLISEGLEVDERFGSSSRPSGGSFLDKLTLRLRADEDLAERLREGNTDAMTVLFERHSALIYRVARRVIQESGEAEEVVQQVFLDAYRAIHQYDARKGAVKPWLLMFAYQRAINRKRHLNSRHFYSSDPLDEALPQLFAGAARPLPFHMNTAEAACLVEEVLSMIQPRQRRVIELVYYQGLTSQEAAKVTGEPISVVRHNLYRGLEKIRGILHGSRLTERF